MLVIVNARFLTQPITGVQKFAIEISIRIKKIFPDIIFVSPPYIIHKDLAEKLEAKTIGRLKSHLWEQIELPLFLKKNNNPILISFANTGPVFYKPQIVTIHDIAFKRNPQWFSRSFVLLYNFVVPRIAKKAEKIITVSDSSKRELIGAYDIDNVKITIIHNAVNNNKIIEFINVKGKYNLTKYILAVGSIDPRKNLRNLIKAFNLIKNKDYKLVIVGGISKVFSNSDLGPILNDNIVFTGYLSDLELASFYSQADVFVYPSLYEGFGIPPLEAMAYGCPTIVSDVNSLREVCEEASFFVNPNSVSAIAEAIDNVLQNNNLKLKLIAAGKNQIKKFSWEKSASEVINLIEDFKMKDKVV